MTMEELSVEMRMKKARCSTYCSEWNSKDKDCKIYEHMHCPPSKCRLFLAQEVTKRNKEKKDK